MNLDQSKLEQLLGTVVNELGAASNAALVVLGDRLGLFRALAEAPMTSRELAERTQTHERYVREWLSAQAASGFVSYDGENDTFCMTPEQAAVFADEDSPVAMVGGFSLLPAVYHDEPRLAEAFRTGKGLHWADHCNCMSCGVDRFFRPGYRAHLIAEWLPALDGVVPKLQRGAKVADVGCGHGYSTRLMAEAFPNSDFTGIDYDEASIGRARGEVNGARNVSLFAVGGANAAIPEMHRLAVDVHHWMTDKQFADVFAISQMSPGPNVLIVTLIGYSVAGVAGALVATLAMCGPTAVVAYYVSRLLARSTQSRWPAIIQAALIPLSIGLMGASGLILAVTSNRTWAAALVTVGAAVLAFATRLNPLWMLLAGGCLGFAGVI